MTSVTGKVLWLRAKDLTGGDGSAQPSWPDASPEGHHGTSSDFGSGATTEPTLQLAVTPNGSPAVKFGFYGRAAKSTYKAMSFPSLGLGSAGEAWIVVSTPYVGGTQVLSPGLWHFGNETSGQVFPYSDGKVYENFGMAARLSFTGGLAANTFVVYRVQLTGGTFRAWINGTLMHTATGRTAGWPTTPILGRSGGGGGNGTFDTQFGGHVAELIVFDHALDSTDAASVAAYLQSEHFTAPASALTVTDHADTVTISGTVTAATITGALSVTDHADTAVISGTTALPPVAGALEVSDHADTVEIGGSVSGLTGGALDVTDHADEVVISGSVTVAGNVLAVVDHADTAVVDGVINGGDTSDHVAFKAAARIGYLTIPTAQPPPAGIDPVPVVRMSHVATPPTEANPIITEGVDYPWTSPVGVGTLHVFVGGVDVTYAGGAPIQSVRRSATSPAGDVAATFEIPAMQAWDKPGEGGYSMLRPDAPVDVALVHDDDTRTHLWSGFLSADAAEVAQGKRNGFTADGTLWQAGYTLHEPPHYLPLTDIGVLIPRALNSVPNKRWSDIPEVTTGILSRDRGASNQSVMQYVMDLLGKAWTADGRQWTLVEVAPREFRVQLKPLMDTADATVTYGAKGIEVNLSREQSTRVDVIYGKGVTAAGGQWRGTRFPGLVLATPPPYPNNDASSLHLGDTDADTDSGTGVSDMQRRLVELGYSLRVDGVLNSNDIDVIRRLQSRMGLLVDGVPGPQTWSGIFNRGPADIDLTQWREPIAAQPWALEHLRDPNGVILGPNPAHDDARIVHAIEVDFGTNITWQQAQPIAERMLAVESEPALTGTIRLRTDPHEVWRGVIKPGWRIKVLGFQGEDVIVRVAAVDVDTDRDGMVVALTVDERARDAMSVAAVLERNRAALPDPARKPGNPQRDSRITRDRYVQWDIDSPCGFFPRTAVFGGLWVAPNPIPFSEVGRFVKAVFSSTVPHALMLFGLPVKPSQMHAIVGNPLATTDPYRPHTEALTRLGWIEAWGEQGQRLGYWPGDEGSGYAFSGKTELIGSVDYVSGYGVWVWPLIYSATTGFVGGGSGDWISRFYPATDT